jgi:phage-related baseplate assembly protein/heme/copper-type cytochrome/quinol oxidase subunit 2
MVNIKSVNEIILNLIDFFKLTKPDLDTKPGTVARDLFIDAPASQLSLLYDELTGVSNKQSLRLVAGTDLDKLAKNFSLTRKQAIPSSGVALLTFASIDAPININQGDIVISTNGLSFSVTTGTSVTTSAINFYKSVATKYRDQLDLAGITDLYAVEVTVIATSAGSASNIGKYSLNRTTIPGVSNVTNINSFAGGADQETDAIFRNRVLATFSGSSVGTTLGYQNAALSTTGVIDATVIEPGDPLMVRDGTITLINPDGSATIISEGTGGKVDIAVLGNVLQQTTDSYIYKDKSNNNDPTDARNDVVLGQIAGDENKTINRKRIDNISEGSLPQQPVSQILQVSGSVSGSNFVQKSVDSYGRVTGNYELIKDTGVYSGSPWGFDKFHWISNKISLFQDEKVKNQFNGQDPATFSGLIQIHDAQQNISITNEDSDVTSDRSILKLLHTPLNNVTRVFNVNTGERYVVTNQNLDNTGIYNTTGRIQISGNTLPVPSDVLQVDYNWIVSYDQYSDFDGLYNTSNIRAVNDSIDWGYASIVRNEIVTFTKTSGTNFFNGTTIHPVSSVATANKSIEVDGTVVAITSGIFIGRLSVVLSNLPVITNTIDSILVKNTNTEQYNTAQANGSFTSIPVLVNANILYTTTIILPTDVVVKNGDRVTVFLNSEDVFHATNSVGSTNGNQITIPADNIDTTANVINLRVSYVASVFDLYSSAFNALPTSRVSNGYLLANNTGFNNFTPVNLARRESQVIQKNFSNQFYVELTLPSNDYTLLASQVISVIRLSDGDELWNSDNLGTIAIGTSGNYQLILTGYNIPVTSERVLVIYYATDNRRYQPFTFQNNLIKYRVGTLLKDFFTNTLYVPINNFVNEINMDFQVLEPNTDIALFTVNDGYLVNNGSTAILGSFSINFSTLDGLLNKKIKIYNSGTNNNGLYDIVGYDLANNTMVISSSLEQINANQISIVRVLDGQEVWNTSGTIDVAGNRLYLPSGANAKENDVVYISFFNYSNLKQSLTRLASTTTDQITNTGTITFAGTTVTKATNIVFTATNTGLRLNLLEAMRKALGISSATAVPSNFRVAKIAKLEKVTTVSNSNDEVVSVLTTYDLQNTIIKNNLLYANDCLSDPTLSNLEFILPSTENNTLNTDVQNLPRIGDKLRVTFYYVNDNDSENLAYTRNGVLYTNKKFAFINRVFVSSGFKTSQSTKLTLTSFTQPNAGARYKAFYDYTAPKQNERIVINYNFNKLVSDVTFNIENTRPINADVIVKAAKEIKLDLTMNVVIDEAFKPSTSTVLQTVRDTLTTALTATNLGAFIDQITLINLAQGVNGIARARILYFNKTGKEGQVLKIQAQNDEYFTPNNIVLNTETR